MQPSRNPQNYDRPPNPSSYSNSAYQDGHPRLVGLQPIQQSLQDERLDRYAPRDDYPYGGFPPDGLGQRTRDVEMRPNGRMLYNREY